MRGAVSLIMMGAVLALCGCERDDQQIKVYRVAKAPLESTPPPDSSMMPTNASSPSTSSLTAPGASNVADVPKNWEPQPLSQMRLASFLVRGANGASADVSFVMLGPAAGNVLDNVNRWLGQLKQAPISEEKLKSMIQPLATTRGDVAVVDLSGEPENGDANKDGRIIGAIASDETGTAFFKMRGNAALVGAEKENFLKWVRASRSASSSAPTTSTSTTTTAVPPTDSEKPAIKWEVPAGWSTAPASAMRYASFAVEKKGEKADVSVVTFPGDGGNDVDNINRWRQQIGLPAVGEEVLKSMIAPVHAGDLQIDSVDMSGTNARVLAAWTRQAGRAWFFKMSGPPALVEQEKTKFTAFLQSIRF
jgi:hypothetical protein